MVRHNNAVPNGHFHKDWQRYVRTNFNQPFNKIRRNLARKKKLLKKTPRPLHLLRPLVHCPSVRYHTKLRPGKGFALQELKCAKLNPHYAKGIGIAVDYRRKNKSYEAVLLNTQRLRTYVSKLILLPGLRNRKKLKVEMPQVAKYVVDNLNAMKKQCVSNRARVPTDEEKKTQVFIKLRKARREAKRLNRKLKRDKVKTDQLDDKK